MEEKKKKPARKPKPTPCESCVHYDYDDETDEMVCGVDLDEDEQLNFMKRATVSCPYYKFYDEYKSVRRQN